MIGRKRSASSRGRGGHVGAPPKRNAPQRQNPGETPQEAVNEVAPLTHNDIPRIMQGFVQSLSDISPREEPTPRDRTAIRMSTRSTGTPTLNSEGTTTRLLGANKGPQREDVRQGSSSSVGQITEESIQRITQGVMQYLEKANASSANGNEEANGTTNTTTTTPAMLTGVNSSHSEIIRT